MVIFPKYYFIFPILGRNMIPSKIHLSHFQTDLHTHHSALLRFSEVNIIDNVIIDHIRLRIVFLPNFIVQIVEELLLVNPGTTPEFHLSSVPALFISFDGTEYQIRIAQIKEILQEHGKNQPEEQSFRDVICIKCPGIFHNITKRQQHGDNQIQKSSNNPVEGLFQHQVIMMFTPQLFLCIVQIGGCVTTGTAFRKILQRPGKTTVCTAMQCFLHLIGAIGVLDS